MATNNPPPSDPPAETESTSTFLRSTATWGVIIGTALWTMFFFGYIIIGALFPKWIPDSWFLRLVTEHPGGTIGVAIAAVSAFSVVAVLDVLSRDPLEIKFFGFELKGAAGPVLLWVICFLAMVAGGNALWDKKGLSLENKETTPSAGKQHGVIAAWGHPLADPRQ